MKKYILTREAATNLLGIIDHIAQDSPEAAERVLDKLEEVFNFLGSTPGAGHYREDLLDLRHKFWNVYSYLVVYRWEERPIHILAIVHGGRDLPRYFEQQELT